MISINDVIIINKFYTAKNITQQRLMVAWKRKRVDTPCEFPVNHKKELILNYEIEKLIRAKIYVKYGFGFIFLNKLRCIIFEKDFFIFR